MVQTIEQLLADHKVINIAHRGASSYYPENTMSAFKAAHRMQADMIELDVGLTKDKKAVVFHDTKLKRCTDATGKLHDTRWSDLQELDAGSWFQETFRGERIPLLKEVLDFAKDTIPLNIEIKQEAVTDQKEDGIEYIIAGQVRDAGMTDQVLVSSFDYSAIEYLAESFSDIPTAVLFNKKKDREKSPKALVEKYRATAFHCSKRELKPDWITECRTTDIPLLVYTVNREKKMNALIESGVSGIFTDRPDILRKRIRELCD